MKYTANLMWIQKGFHKGYTYLSRALIYWSSRRMASTCVRCIPGEDRMQITVEYSHNEDQTLRAYNMDRNQQEELSITLDRLKLNLAKKLFKKKRKKKNNASGQGTEVNDKANENNLNVIIINSNGGKVDDNTPNYAAWTKENRLRIQNTDIPIVVNAPSVKIFALPQSIMAGFPIFPKFELEFADLRHCDFAWEVIGSSPQEETPPLGAEGGKSEKDMNTLTRSSSNVLSSDQIFTPSISEIGQRLKLTCIPKLGNTIGKEDSVVSDEVKPGPGLCPFETRHLYTTSRTEADR